MSAMAPESAIEVDLLVLRRDEFFLGEQERRALERLAPRLGGTSAADDGFEATASLALKLIVSQRCGGGEVRRSPCGKPFVAAQPFCWSLSHDPSLVCAAFAPVSIGIDVEPLMLPDSIRLAALDRAAPSALGRWVRKGGTEWRRAVRFTLAWTATEAALKASGEGFVAPGALSAEAFGRWRYGAHLAGGCLITCACSHVPKLHLRPVGHEELVRALREAL